ncbi:type II toxin-antitoxin system RelE/ParE family toxin [Waterburya agarophytonicola]|nr:type II toxin-antitoxin system RelE/ParE family toxin [Waterburya agarophytonicola]
MILLHGFIKKSQKTPKKEIELAAHSQKEHQKYER